MTKLIVVVRNFSNARKNASVQIITNLPYLIIFVCHTKSYCITSVEGTDLQVSYEPSCCNIYGRSIDYNLLSFQTSVGTQCWLLKTLNHVETEKLTVRTWLKARYF